MNKKFLYFLPGVSGCNERKLSDRGLRSRFVSSYGDSLTGYSITPILDGPEGNGVIVALGSNPSEYDPARQTWEKCGAFWLGVEFELSPGAGDLVREVGVDGPELLLNDGGRWRIPLLRFWNPELCEHESTLPRCIKPVDGRMRKVILPKFAPLDALAERVWQAFLNEETLPLERIFADCAELLSINYRVGVEEIAALGLLTEESALRMLEMCIDISTLKAHAAEVSTSGLIATEPTIVEED